MASSSNGTTHTNSDRVGWVSSHSGRSTSDILWSCASIFLVCSWKCIHLNIPRIEETRAGWHRCCHGTIPYWPERPLRRKWLRKLNWMAIVVVAPEVGVSMAIKQYFQAKKVASAMERFGWVMTHGFYVGMGGIYFGVRDQKGELNHKDKSDEAAPKVSEHQSAMTTSMFELGNVAGAPAADSKRGEPTHLEVTEEVPENLWYFEGDDFLSFSNYLNSAGLRFPTITEESIQDRSKADVFTKAFALAQSSWLIVQSIARAAAGLPISQLELATVAFIVCAFVMYIFWWNKPFEVGHKTITLCPAETRDYLNYHGFSLNPEGFKIDRKEDMSTLEMDVMVNPGLQVTSSKRFVTFIISLTFYATGIVFSAIHIAAWNWEFPGPISRTLWRVFALTSTGAAMAVLCITLCEAYVILMERSATPVFALRLFVLPTSIVSYVISRLGLIVLIFYCFSSMPASVYETVKWTNFLPHFQ